MAHELVRAGFTVVTPPPGTNGSTLPYVLPPTRSSAGQADDPTFSSEGDWSGAYSRYINSEWERSAQTTVPPLSRPANTVDWLNGMRSFHTQWWATVPPGPIYRPVATDLIARFRNHVLSSNRILPSDVAQVVTQAMWVLEKQLPTAVDQRKDMRQLVVARTAKAVQNIFVHLRTRFDWDNGSQVLTGLTLLRLQWAEGRGPPGTG